MKKLLPVIALFVCGIMYSQIDSLKIANEIYQQKIDSIEKSFNYEYDTVDLLNGIATINIPSGYKFLNAEQSAYVLTDLWGNPPSEVLGLLFPKDISPMSDNFTYAVEVTYSADGYIEDDDAEDIDYDDLLEEMQNDTELYNKERVKEGYEKIELLGWASPPFYDKENKKLHWAKELKFENYEVNTLNYNIRVLGREGYLNLNAIGDMEVLPLLNSDIDTILNSVEFNEGYAYADFDASVDNVAAYGIGGLIAGKMLAKAGVFAGLLKFWKIIAIAVVGAFGALRKKIFKSE
ncbi:Uncharacterized membrane-anchored protein [Lutibacter oricola]|uniref:Uncharacterized membrane-anchored protein n=1 Tax=Lutibacter oricola TaxID=762486 RepID=A0A1H3EZ92_9FLAO|nr:DUF2167 domain-containing protein [Lutibacter oricola]SDX83269.1 Uncharacterized membrane-anchored protein [Lutibacter oricola]